MTKKIGAKNHIAGKKVSGTHTSVIDGVSKILNKFAKMNWFISARAGEITTGKKVGGGAPFVSVNRHKSSLGTPENDAKIGGFKNTLTLTFKRSGVIQKIYVQTNDLENNLPQIIEDMRKIVTRQWKGAELVDRVEN